MTKYVIVDCAGVAHVEGIISRKYIRDPFSQHSSTCNLEEARSFDSASAAIKAIIYGVRNFDWGEGLTVMAVESVSTYKVRDLA